MKVEEEVPKLLRKGVVEVEAREKIENYNN